MSPDAHHGQSQTQGFEVARLVEAAAAASMEASADDVPPPKDGNSHPPFSVHHVSQQRSFDYACSEEAKLVDHREETGVYREERLAVDAGMLSCLEEMDDDDECPPTCFGSHHLWDVYWEPCIPHQIHGLA